MLAQFGIDALSLSHEIRVESANNNARVSGRFSVQSDEMFAVDRQNRAVARRRKRQNFVIFDSLIGFASFENRENIMAQLAQFGDDRKGKILVGVEPCHDSSGLILPNLLFDFGAIRAHERPGVG